MSDQSNTDKIVDKRPESESARNLESIGSDLLRLANAAVELGLVGLGSNLISAGTSLFECARETRAALHGKLLIDNDDALLALAIGSCDKKNGATRRINPHDHELYEGHDLKATNWDVVWSVGVSPRHAIEAFCIARLGARIEGELTSLPDEEASTFDWGYRFVADGTSMKAAGINVPGGVILTWWK